MQLEQIFWKISSIFRLFLSKSTVEQIYLKVYLQLTDYTQSNTNHENRP